jgi:3-hydroxybutyrate dehydrogenase
MDQAEGELLGAKQPMRRFSTPEAIGAMVVFLCGEAATTITGAALAMDGGWTCV